MKEIDQWIEEAWRGETLEALKDVIRIPSKSRAFDEDWETHGFLTAVLKKAQTWGRKLFPNGAFEIIQDPGLTPILFVDIPATDEGFERPAFFYGHFDKQPEAEGWAAGLGPWEPVVRNGRLYGRGAADDCYSFYASLTAAKALDEFKIARPRVTGLFETDEESGSRDLPFYLEKMREEIGNPAFLGIFDLSVRDYERLWLTQSLRGVVSFTMKVSVLETPVHSGTASGIVPSSFAIVRMLLDRLEDPCTGRVKLREFHAEIPAFHQKGLEEEAALAGDAVFAEFPYKDGTQPRHAAALEALRANAWEPALSILGAEGLPSISSATAVIRPSTAVALSFRVPPGVDAKKALQAAIDAVTTNVPFNASVEIDNPRAESGFESPELDPWLSEALEELSKEYFGNSFAKTYEGATIGTLGAFRRNFSQSCFLNTGVLGSKEHAHAPNESLDLQYVAKFTQILSKVVARTPKN